MSGVFGVVNTTRDTELGALVEKMEKSLTHYAWYVSEHYTDPDMGVCLGRIGSGVFNRNVQPIHDPSKRISLIFAGELTHVDGIRQALKHAGREPRNDSDEELILTCYTVWGMESVSRLQGQFVCAILDRVAQVCFLANDRFGLYPTYYAVDRRRLLFAPEIKALMQDAMLSRSLRDDALAEYFRFQRLLGAKTFFEAVHLLPPATVLQFDLRTGDHTLTRYWDLGMEPLQPASTTIEDAIEEGARRFAGAMKEAMRGQWRIGVYLSGGLDSRAIAGMLAQLGGTFDTFTFGQPGCRDEIYARQIANVVSARHHFYPYLNGHWIEEYAPVHVRLTEGFHSWLHMHGINMLDDVRIHIDINISGLGDLLWPDENFTPLRLLKAPDELAFSSIFFDLYHQNYSWPGLTDSEERSLYSIQYSRRLVGLAYDSFMRELATYAHLPFPTRAAAFNLTNHFTRHLLYHCVFGRSHLEYRLPYFDLDLLSFAYGLPIAVAHNRQVQKGIIARYLPRVARIASTTDDMPIIIDNQSQNIAKVLLKLRRAAAQLIAPGPVERPKLYADYEGWLRGDLRSWAESILFDQRTLDRGIFRRDALSSLWSRHLSGNELWTVGKIASIITFEMAMREFSL